MMMRIGKVHPQGRYRALRISISNAFFQNRSLSTDSNIPFRTRMTERLLNRKEMPLGSLANITWKQGEETLRYWARRNVFDSSLALLERLLLERAVWRKYRMENESIYALHVDTLNLVLQSWVNAWKNRTGTVSLKTPNEMLHWVDHWTATDPQLRPDIQTYQLLMEGARYFTDEPASRIGELLLRRALRAYPNEPALRPNIIFFHTLMHTYIREQDIDKAETLLTDLERLFFASGHNPAFAPTPATYTILMTAWAQNFVPRSTQVWLDRMVEFAKIEPNILQPDRTHFQNCMNAWYNSKDRAAGIRAETLLLQMQEYYKQYGWDTQPKMENMIKAIHCWVDSRCHDAGERAWNILKIMKELDDREPEKLVGGYLAVLKAWSYAKRKDAPEIMEEVIEELETQVKNIPPTKYRKAVAFVITAWARCSREDAAERAQRVFDRVKERYEAGEVDYEPSLDMYNSLLSAWAKAKQGHKAQAILDDMLKNGPQPDLKSFNNVIVAWRHSSDADSVTRTENAFHCMERQNVKPDQTTYHTLISSLAFSNSVDYARRGDRYFQELKTRSRAGDKRCALSTLSFNKAIQLWSKIGTTEAVETVERYLEEMTQLVAQGNRNVKPDQFTEEACSTVYRNCGISRDYQGSRRVQKLFKRSHRK